jgi:hypothetical protein
MNLELIGTVAGLMALGATPLYWVVKMIIRQETSTQIGELDGRLDDIERTLAVYGERMRSSGERTTWAGKK